MIREGSLFILTSGEYSDYELITLCRATADIDIESLRAEYMILHPEQDRNYGFKRSQFIKWLVVDRKVCEELDYFEWYIDYSTADFSLSKDGFDVERWTSEE